MGGGTGVLHGWVSGPFSGSLVLCFTVFSRARTGLCRAVTGTGLSSLADLSDVAVFSEAMMNPPWDQ